MHRHLSKGLTWIQERGPERPGIVRTATQRAHQFGAAWCPPDARVFIPQNAYLVAGEETLLLDTLSPAYGASILDVLDQALEGRSLDYLVISHPDVPHAGNAARILRRYPQATLVAPRYGDLHDLYELGGAKKVGEGDSIDLGGRVVHFHEAPFLDAPMHLWMSDESTRTLFCVDWMGLPLIDDQTLLCLDEVVDADTTYADLVDRYYEFHARVMFWFQYVDVAKVAADMDWVREHHAPLMMAPSHGPPVRAQQPNGPPRFSIEQVFEANKEAMARVRETGRVGVL